MKRFVATNRDVMWTSDLDDIQWNNSNAGVQKAALGAIRLPSRPKGIFNRYAGTLWTGLIGFDATLRQIYEKQLKPGSYQYAYYHNVTRQQPPAYERKHGELPAAVLDFPFSSCSSIVMAAVMPASIERGQSAVVACRGRLAGDVRVELRSEDGARSLGVLKEAKLEQSPFGLNVPWQTGDVEPGRYRIRWTLKGEYREFPVEVR